MVEIVERNIEGLYLVKENDEEWYAFEFDSGTIVWFREKNGVLETRVEQ